MIRERDSDVVTGRPGGDGLGEDRDAARAGVRESLCLKLMSARQASDALDSSHQFKHANTFQTNTSIPPPPPPHDDNTTTTLCTAAILFTNTSKPRNTLLTGLCRKSKAGEASTRESEQPTLIYETRHTHALSGPTLDTTRVPRDSHDLRSLYMTLRCIYHANSSASYTSTCNETHTHSLRLSLS